MTAENLEALRYYYRGRVFEATGEYESAIEEYKKAIEYGADYADVHNSLGRTFLKMGFYEEAKTEFEKALELNPKYQEAQRNLNEVLIRIKLLKEQKQKEIPTPPLQQPQFQYSQVQSTSPPPPPVSPVINLPSTELPPPPIASNLPPPPIVSGKSLSFQNFIKNNLKFLTIFGSLVIFIFSSVALYKKFIPKTLSTEKVYNTSNETISSIIKLKDRLALSSWSTQEIIFYKILDESLKPIDVINFKNENIVPTSVFFKKNKLYVLDVWNKKLYKFNLTELKPQLIKVADISEYNPIGIANFKNYLLLFDADKQQMIIYNEDLKKIEVVPFVVKNVLCVSSYKNKIWILDKNYTLHELRNYKEVKNSYKINFATNKLISCFFIDNRYFWYSEEGASKINVVPKSFLEKG